MKKIFEKIFIVCLKGIAVLIVVGGFLLVSFALVMTATNGSGGELGYHGTDTGMGIFIGIVVLMFGIPFLILIISSIFDTDDPSSNKKDGTKQNGNKP